MRADGDKTEQAAKHQHQNDSGCRNPGKEQPVRPEASECREDTYEDDNDDDHNATPVFFVREGAKQNDPVFLGDNRPTGTRDVAAGL